MRQEFAGEIWRIFLQYVQLLSIQGRSGALGCTCNGGWPRCLSTVYGGRRLQCVKSIASWESARSFRFARWAVQFDCANAGAARPWTFCCSVEFRSLPTIVDRGVYFPIAQKGCQGWDIQLSANLLDGDASQSIRKDSVSSAPQSSGTTWHLSRWIPPPTRNAGTSCVPAWCHHHAWHGVARSSASCVLGHQGGVWLCSSPLVIARLAR